DPAAPQAMFEGTSALAFSPDGRTLAAVSFYEYKSNHVPLAKGERDVRTVVLWEVATGKIRHDLRLPRNSITCVAFVGGGALALGDRGGAVRLYDVGRGSWLPPFRGHQDQVAALALSADGQALASGSWDTTALVWPTAAVLAQLPSAAVERTPRELGALW